MTLQECWEMPRDSCEKRLHSCWINSKRDIGLHFSNRRVIPVQNTDNQKIVSANKITKIGFYDGLTEAMVYYANGFY